MLKYTVKWLSNMYFQRHFWRFFSRKWISTIILEKSTVNESHNKLKLRKYLAVSYPLLVRHRVASNLASISHITNKWYFYNLRYLSFSFWWSWCRKWFLKCVKRFYWNLKIPFCVSLFVSGELALTVGWLPSSIAQSRVSVHWASA